MAIPTSPAAFLKLPKRFLFLAIAVVSAVFLWAVWLPYVGSPHSLHISPASPQPPSTQESSQDDCATLPGASDVLVVLKTGATEIYEKLPVHFLTLLSCAPNYLLVSDVEQEIGSYHVHDVLANVSDRIKTTYSDFEAYRQYKKFEGQDLTKFKGDKAWNLDKWKFLPMVRLAYKTRPKAKWFLFIEADTAVIWTNLLQWLNQLDPSVPIYSGSQNSINGITFAHGGSGVLVSNAALKKLEEAYPNHSGTWEELAGGECCGDVALARYFLDSGVQMTASFPLLQGEAPFTIDWNDRHMCAPIVTWHHVGGRDINTLWQLQRDWTSTHGSKTPFMFRDLFKHYRDLYIRPRRDAWDNISQDWKFEKDAFAGLTETQKKSVESFDACRDACIEKEECLQFKYKPGECALGRDIRIGTAQDDSPNAMKSGWLLDRVDAFYENFKDCDANWSFNQR